MALLRWKDHYSVGIEGIDHEHKDLIELINRLYCLVLVPELSSSPSDRPRRLFIRTKPIPTCSSGAYLSRWRAPGLSVAGDQQHQVLAECKGGGLRDSIASSFDRGIPVVIGVSGHCGDAWRKFAGDFAVEMSANASEVERWLEGLR